MDFALVLARAADNLLPLAEPFFDDHLLVVRQAEFDLFAAPLAVAVSDHIRLLGDFDDALDRNHQDVGDPLRLDLDLGGQTGTDLIGRIVDVDDRHIVFRR